MCEVGPKPIAMPIAQEPIAVKVGAYGDSVYFNEAERVYSACVVFRGEAEKLVNNGKAFNSFQPISYQAQVVAGMNYKIQVEVTGPSQIMPIEPPVIAKNILEMTVYWGLPPATPELTEAKLLQPLH
ncbi:uncharacterized protein LOC144872224 [Branchiostoma floridae x Branchiostoma japonicum]